MSDDFAGFWSSLTTREAQLCERAIDALGEETWAAPLLARIKELGGISTKTMAHLFELRVGYELYRAGVAPSYEVAGEGGTTIDYGFTSGGASFLVELLRLEETDAALASTVLDTSGVFPTATRSLSSSAADARQSEEGETLKAIQRICQKFERDGKPYKFPLPDHAVHVLLVDMRTFLDGGDKHDYRHIAFGAGAVHAIFRRFWNKRPITGVFSNDTTLKGAVEVRERLHILGLVQDTRYVEGSLNGGIHLFLNPHLALPGGLSHDVVFKRWPLQATQMDAPA